MDQRPPAAPHPSAAPARRRRRRRVEGEAPKMRFRRESGAFKVVQVADIHYADGRSTGCVDVLLSQAEGRSDLDTTAFLYRVLRAEDPDLVVFTGDNIYGADATDAAKSMDAAIAPPIDMKLPWAAVLGNHDQEGALSREGVMRHLVGTTNSHSSFNPEGVEIDSYGNYNFAVYGVEGSPLSEKSVLNLYFLDSGDYSTVSSVHGYGWIKRSQQDWFQKICSSLQRKYMNHYPAQKEQAPGIAFFHMLLPEFSSFTAINITGVKQEGISWISTLGSFPPWWRLEM